MFYKIGAGGGGRTRTLLPERDFESRASASSTTPACHIFNYINKLLPVIQVKPKNTVSAVLYGGKISIDFMAFWIIIFLYINLLEVDMYIAYASDAAGTTSRTGGWMSWVIILVMFAALYFLMIRPQNKRDKEARNMRNNLKPGDEIITIGGIYGKIVRVTEDRVVIMVGSEKVKLEMAKSAISGLADASAANTSSASKAKTAPEPEEEKNTKPSPKSIRKLGAKKEEAEEAVADAVEETAAVTEEIAEAAEEVADAVKADEA